MREEYPLSLAEQAVHLGGEIICAEYGLVGSTDLATKVVKALGKVNKAALLKNHGTVVIAQSIEEAFALSDILEHGAQIAVFGQILGGVLSVDANNILDPSLLK
jgi:L-fuculose-phosphate aldolase